MYGKSILYGFEDYKMIFLAGDFLGPDWLSCSYTCPKLYCADPGSYLVMEKPLPVEIDEYYSSCTFLEGTVVDHKELLETAKKVYVHKDCHLSRTLVASKYKKCLNPWLSDVVVIPGDSHSMGCRNVALFIDEDSKVLVLCNIYDTRTNTTSKELMNAPDGTRLGDLLPKTKGIYDYAGPLTPREYEGVKNSKLMYKGSVIRTESRNSYCMDILTNSIPLSKLVFEDTLHNSLASDENKITLESLISIGEMLDSSDNDTVSAGLKALSMLDYAHYPNSVKYILNHSAGRYRWSKAFDSVPVKFMLQKINSIRHWRGRNTSFVYDDNIYEDDYNLYKQLLKYYSNSEQDVMGELRYQNFMTLNESGVLVPRLRPKD